MADLGGADRASQAEASIIRRASVIETELEILEAAFATAGGATPEQLDLYGRTAGNLRRLLESVGLERRPRDVTPALSDYISARAVTTPASVPPVPLPACKILPPPPLPIRTSTALDA